MAEEKFTKKTSNEQFLHHHVKHGIRNCFLRLCQQTYFSLVGTTNLEADSVRRKNFDQICRLCLEYAPDKKNLFPLFINDANVPGFYGRFLKEFKESISDVISACIGIEVDPTEKLPLNICSSCEKQLIASNQFRIKCLQSNEHLQKLSIIDEADDFDTDDDTPLDSLKYPELIIVDKIKDEFKEEDTEMDSSSNSVWDNLGDSMEADTTINENIFVKTESQKSMKKAAVKRSKTIPLITPSTPIVPVNCDESINSNGSQPSKNDLPKNPVKYHYPKKPKMCTVCGIIVDRLRDHMRIHPDALEYCCSICPKKYLTKKGLLKHIRHKHTEDSSFENKINGGQDKDVDNGCNRNLWQSSLRKRFRQMGETYIAVDGTEKIGRSIKLTCPNSCYLKCQSNIDDAQRLEIHKSFWKLTDNDKDVFYAKNVKRINSLRKRTKAEQSQRSFSFTYFFDIYKNGEVLKRVQVCQKFFINTLDISKGRVYYYFQNIHDSEKGGPMIERHVKKRKDKNVFQIK